MSRFIAIIISFCIFSSVFAEGKIVLNSSSEEVEINLEENLFYFIDTFSTYSFEQVLDPEFVNRFNQSESAEFFYHNNSYPQWYKLNIENQSEEYQELILGINNPLIRRMTIFSSLDSVFYNAGMIYPYDQRQIEYKNFLYELRLKPNQSGVICIRVDGQANALYVPISLDYEEHFDRKLSINQFISGLFYAMIFLMLLLLVVLWGTEKDRSYIFFFGLSFLILAFKLWRDNILFDWLWSNSPQFNIVVGQVLLPLIFAAILLFVNQILFLVKQKPLLKNLFKGVVIFGLVFTFAQFLISKPEVNVFLYKLYAIALFVIVAWGVFNARGKGIKYFVRYSIVFLTLAMFVVLSVLFDFNSRGIGMFDEHLSKLVLSVFFLVVGNVFITKFKSSRKEVTLLNKNLEHLVVKRTAQLNQQKEELKSQHEELILQKETLQTQREELRAQKELLEMKNVELEKLSLVASKTDNLIYIFKPNGELDWFNTSFSMIIGITYEEYKRRDPLTIEEVSNNKNIRHVLNTCLREKTVVSYESQIEKESSELSWYHTTLTPILDKQEDVRLLIAIDTNITKLKQFEADLSEQKQDAEMQRNIAVQSKDELEEKNVEVMDSIRYAKRIQSAIMPKIKQIQRDFPDSYVLFLPKDIVSGDFYWYHRIGDKFFMAAVDCTGHGVPGAFMSIIGNYLLNNIIIHNGVTDPAEILKQLNRKIKIAMKADSRAQTADGMDLSLAVIDKDEQTIAYAGAIRPMYMFNNGDFIEAKGDKTPITSSISGVALSSFKTKYFDYNIGDTIYMFSDGIIDQFGGEKGKKFLTKRFKKLLFDVNDLPMKDQKDYVKKAFDDWKGNNEQVDDILVMGVRF